ncbi:MAG: GNAT family N-acetyltransferase [Pseudobutyrivibrio sp.]|nr:GNAT family N-acetyltransferase [Pseudobutyrivibrio sp.]
MLRLRPYKKDDAKTIISWTKDENAFYKWTAGVMGEYPITEKEFGFVDGMIAFTAFEDNEIVGFFTFRNPGDSLDELRIGFVIIAPSRRGKGTGKEMLRLALKYAFEVYGAKSVCLGVFENNMQAYHCYKSVGFKDLGRETIKKYPVLNEEWTCKEMVIMAEKNYSGD